MIPTIACGLAALALACGLVASASALDRAPPPVGLGPNSTLHGPLRCPSGANCDVSALRTTPSLSATPDTLASIIAWLSGVATVADLRSNVRPVFLSAVTTLGYARVGDGGGARYFYSASATAPDDGCAVIAAPVGRWLLDLSGPIDVRQCGAKLDDATDDTVSINKAIAARGILGGTVVVPPNAGFLAGGIVHRSGVALQGPGEYAGLWKCTSDPCNTKVAGLQLSGITVSGFQFAPADASLRTATIFKFGTLNKSYIVRNAAFGFITEDGGVDGGATWVDLGGEAKPGPAADLGIGWNVIGNVIGDNLVQGCGVCVKLRGRYADGPNQGNGDPPYPAQVATHNTFERNYFIYVENVGVRIENSADTNIFRDNLWNLHGKTVVGVIHGYDPNYVGHNTWVGATKFPDSVFSADSRPQRITLFQSDVYSSALEGDEMESDIDRSRAGYTAVRMPLARSYRICGKAVQVGSPNDLLGCI